MATDSIDKIYSQLYFSKEKANSIGKLFDKIQPGNEFEVMFYNYKSDRTNALGMENFLTILEYLKKRSKVKKEKIIEDTTLDVAYSTDMTNYRITIVGIDSIRDYLSFVHKRKNHVIFKILLGKMLSGDKNIKLIKKVRDNENIFDLDEYNVRFRMSSESEVTSKEIEELKKIDETVRHKITFRYKQRVSLFINEGNGEVLRIDLTNTKQTNSVNKIESSVPRFELEVDYMVEKKTGNKIKLENIYNLIEVLHKVIQESNFIISTIDEEKVLTKYRELLELPGTKNVTLDGRKAQSLEIQHVVDILPNRYAVTDKADGERSFLIIIDSEVYIISDTLHVKKTGITLDSKSKSFNNSVLDGEYIFIAKHNRHLFMVFDCLFSEGKDIRKNPILMERLDEAQKVIDACFTLKGQKGYSIKDYKGKFNVDDIVSFHEKQISDYMDAMDHDIQKEKLYPLIRRKYFIPVYGGQDNEIFKYSLLLWKKYVLDSNTKCPYILDGMIYHPLDQKYTTSVKDTKFFEYKWKPVDKNSIDFYIKFERDPATDAEYVLFDNSRSEFVQGKPYKICHLYVGKTGKNGEQPTLFQREANKYIAYLFLTNGEVRDAEGNIIKDGTVVEFAYNMDSTIDEKYRWRPLRTRYDKTESVLLHGQRYGNYITVANRVWRSITNPFTVKDIEILAKDSQYRQQIDLLRNKIDHTLILSERKENVYHQIRTNLAIPMRNFHNWIKSILIYTYCNQAYERGKKQVVLDIGSGRGVDIMKFYYTMVALYVGIDIDGESLLSAVDGAVSRYEQLRKTHPNFPKMTFIQADGGVILDYESQFKALGGMSKLNKSLLEKHFSLDKKNRTIFDRINCQFALHYFLADNITWGNFCTNLDMYLKEGGYFIFTCFDGREIFNLLKESDKYTSYYTNEKGEKKIMFEIIKKYSNDDIKNDIGIGIPIDFHNAIDFQEGVYVTEYLVDKDFITKELEKHCDLELVDTDLFGNQFHIHADFFKFIYQYEENPKTKEFFRKVAQFYNQSDSVNKAGYDLTRLYRYYVYRRKENSEKPTKTAKAKAGKKIKQKGGELSVSATESDIKPMDMVEPLEGYEYVLGDGTFFIKGNNNFKQFTFQEGIYDSLRTDNIIPANISMNEFYEDLGINIINDNDLNHETITEISKKIQIDHEINGKTQNVLNGINIILLEEDCDGDVDISYYNNKKNLKSKDKSIVFYKNKTGYHPVYNSNLESVYENKSAFIKNIGK